MLVTLAFFDDRPPLAVYENAVELPSTPQQIARDCGAGLPGCVLIPPNHRDDRCFVVVPLAPERRGAVSRLTRMDCRAWSNEFPKK